MGPHPDRSAAVVLLSGGLDSATVLAMARAEGRACHAVAFDYGQRHRHELEAARDVARALGATSFRVVPVAIGGFGGSALTDPSIGVPKDRDERAMAGAIPVTYVPARNLVFLSLATALAETLGAAELWIGVNAVDYSGYPDCRREFIEAFERAANLGTRAGVDGRSATRVRTPLVSMSKAEIIRAGVRLGVEYSMTHSCYDPVGVGGGVLACGRCDSCRIRAQGFSEAGLADPTRYAAGAPR
jgi:7-cyano-7-deazaguanine synthase